MSKFQMIHGQSAYLSFESWLGFMKILFSLELSVLWGVLFIQRKRSPITEESLQSESLWNWTRALLDRCNIINSKLLNRRLLASNATLLKYTLASNALKNILIGPTVYKYKLFVLYIVKSSIKLLAKLLRFYIFVL